MSAIDRWFDGHASNLDRASVEVRMPSEVLWYDDQHAAYTWLRIGGVRFMFRRDEARAFVDCLVELLDVNEQNRIESATLAPGAPEEQT